MDDLGPPVAIIPFLWECFGDTFGIQNDPKSSTTICNLTFQLHYFGLTRFSDLVMLREYSGNILG